MLDLGDTLIICDFEVSTISFKIYVFLMMFSVKLRVMGELVCSRIYGSPRIFIYDGV